MRFSFSALRAFARAAGDLLGRDVPIAVPAAAPDSPPELPPTAAGAPIAAGSPAGITSLSSDRHIRAIHRAAQVRYLRRRREELMRKYGRLLGDAGFDALDDYDRNRQGFENFSVYRERTKEQRRRRALVANELARRQAQQEYDDRQRDRARVTEAAAAKEFQTTDFETAVSRAAAAMRRSASRPNEQARSSRSRGHGR